MKNYFMLAVMVVLAGACSSVRLAKGDISYKIDNQAQTIASAIEDYHKITLAYPATMTDLVNGPCGVTNWKPCISAKSLVDPWGHQYKLEMAKDGSGYEIRSAGPDGMFDTGDDYVWKAPPGWKPPQNTELNK